MVGVQPEGPMKYTANAFCFSSYCQISRGKLSRSHKSHFFLFCSEDEMVLQLLYQRSVTLVRTGSF